MSRGLGALQRRVLAALESRETVALSLDVAALAFGTNSLTAAQDAATRRALRGLAARGLVEQVSQVFRRGQRAWGTPSTVAAYHQRVRAAFGGSSAEVSP